MAKGKSKTAGRDKDAVTGMNRERLEQKLKDWENGELAEFTARQPEGRLEYKTASGLPLGRVYTALDTAAAEAGDISLPGQYPFTRGPYPTMYRGRLWTMRQIAGFGTGTDTNERFKYLIAQGQTGLSTDFDMPTLMGYDSDHPMCRGEVGREGVAIDTLADMEALFDGIDLTEISVSMTINPSAWILYAMYVSLAEKRGDDLNLLSGTIQNDILKELHRPEGMDFPGPAVHAHRQGYHRLWRPAHETLQPGQHFRPITFPRPGQQLSRKRRSPCATPSPTWKRWSRPACRWTTSRPGFPITSSPRPISSRRSPSSGPSGGSTPRS